MRADRANVLALAAVLTLQLMLTLDAQVMTVALPTVRDELGFTPAQLAWVPNAYALAFGGLVLLGGRLGDSYGRVRVFLIGTSVFVVASVAGGLAPESGTLVAARVLQGVGAAMAAPCVLALITTTAKDARAKARGLSYFTAVSAVGASAGLIVGGVLTDLASWRWGLLVNAPIGVVVMIIVRLTLRDAVAVRDTRFDVPGALLATLSSVSLVWAFIDAADHGWDSPVAALLLVTAVVLLSVLVVVERRAARPLIAVHLLTDRARAGTLVAMALTVGAHFAMLFMIAQYIQRVLLLSPLMAGIAFLPLTMTVFVVARVVPRLVRRFGPLPLLVLGGLSMATSFVVWSTLDTSSSYVAVLIPLVIHAAGAGLIFVSGTLVVMGRVPSADAGSAAGMLQMVQQVGGSLGLAVVVSVYAAGASPGEFVPGLGAALLTAGALSVLAALVAAVFVRGVRVVGRRPDRTVRADL